jgi:hypothetical protein
MASNVTSRVIFTFTNYLILLCVAVVLIGTGTASADPGTYVWWQLDSGDGSAITSGMGQTLQIVPAAGSFAHQYNLSMWIATDATPNTSGCTGYRNHIWRGSDHDMAMTNDPTTGLLNPLGWTGPSGYTAGTLNNGDYLIANYGRARGAGAQPINAVTGPLKLIAMTVQVTGSNSPHYIYQTVGTNLYGWNPVTPPTLNIVTFGANSSVYGGAAVNTWSAASQTLPVIAIIPEPATLALFGVGLLMLTRRRAS